jgi:hypothetical protein
MAEEAPVKLIQIGPKGGTKKDGFNLVTERVVAVNPEAKQLEVELLAYDGKTVVLDVGDEALEDFLKIKPGDGATIRVVEEGGKRIAKSFRIRAKDPNAAKADAMLIDLKDSHWLNRKYAAEVLGELKDPRAVLPLVEALTDEVGDVRQRAYDSLIKIGGIGGFVAGAVAGFRRGRCAPVGHRDHQEDREAGCRASGHGTCGSR